MLTPWKLLFTESVHQANRRAVIGLASGAGNETRLLVIRLDHADRPVLLNFPIQPAACHPHLAEIGSTEGSKPDLGDVVPVISSPEQDVCIGRYFVTMTEGVQLRANQETVDIRTGVRLVYATA